LVGVIVLLIAVRVFGKAEGNFINPGTLTALGLFFIALHLAPVRSPRWRRR